MPLREFMRIVGLSRATVFKKIRNGELEVVRLSPRKLAVEPQVIRDFIATRRSNGPSDDDGRSEPAIVTSAEVGGGVDAA